MHEMSLAEGVLQIIEDNAVQQGYRRVTEVRLVIGALSGVEMEAIAFCLDVVLKNSIADGANIELERVAGRGFCLACGETVEIEALFDACPTCGRYQVQATGGMEMQIKDMLVE